MPHPVYLLGNLGNIAQGLSVSRYRDDEGKGVTKLVVNVKDLDNLYINHDLEKIQLSHTTKLERYTLNENDVIIAIRGSLLKSAVITKASERSIAGANVAMFKPNLNKVNPAYIAVLLRSEWMKRSLYRMPIVSSTTLRSIRVSEVRTIEIPLPSQKIQDEIANLYYLTEEYTKLTLQELEAKQQLTESVLISLLEK